MPQTIHQRQQLRDMRRGSARRELRGNVIEWRRQAAERAPLRAIRPPPPPRPLFPTRVENIFLALVSLVVLAIAHKTGVLALIARAIGDLL